MADEPIGDPRPPQFTLRGLLVLTAVAAMLLGIIVPAIRGARDAARTRECENNLKYIGMSLLNYHCAFGSFPMAYTTADGRLLHSWRMNLMPFIEQWPFGGEVQDRPGAPWDKPWDHDDNARFRADCLYCYNCPADDSVTRYNGTSYLAVIGANTAWPGETARRQADFERGTSNLIFLVEAIDPHIHWMEPRDLQFDTLELAINGQQTPGISSNHAKGANVLMGDGSVRCLPPTTAPETLGQMLQIREPESSGTAEKP